MCGYFFLPFLFFENRWQFIVWGIPISAPAIRFVERETRWDESMGYQLILQFLSYPLIGTAKKNYKDSARSVGLLRLFSRILNNTNWKSADRDFNLCLRKNWNYTSVFLTLDGETSQNYAGWDFTFHKILKRYFKK